MVHPTIHCEQTCRGICTSLEAASSNELKAIILYSALRDQCTYPDIQIMLNELIDKRQEIIKLIQETQDRMKQKFEVLDQIRESFEA